jgi:hypothetical protein
MLIGQSFREGLFQLLQCAFNNRPTPALIGGLFFLVFVEKESQPDQGCQTE